MNMLEIKQKRRKLKASAFLNQLKISYFIYPEKGIKTY